METYDELWHRLLEKRKHNSIINAAFKMQEMELMDNSRNHSKFLLALALVLADAYERTQADLIKAIHKKGLPEHISQALNEGDGTYRP